MHKFEGSRIKVSGRIRERCHRGNRFFTPCHVAASLLSHTAFLPPFRMTIEGESVIMRETLIVILNECEGSIYTRGEEIGKMSFRAGAKEAF